MGEVGPKIVKAIQNAIPDIYEAIKQTKIEASFDIKFVVYRNYNSKE
jgi:hypothetical protein